MSLSIESVLFQSLDLQESIVLLHGAPESGKSGLLAQAAKHADARGARVARTRFQSSALAVQDEPTFYYELALNLTQQLAFPYDFHEEWLDFLGPNLNLELLLKAALEAAPEPIVWLLDDIDMLFTLPFASDFFGQIRSWHNRRALQPDGPWSKLTMVLAYANEASELITDPNQSPFNVGRRLELPGTTD